MQNPFIMPFLFRGRAVLNSINLMKVSYASTHQVVFNKKTRIHHVDISASMKDAHIYDYIKDHAAKDLCDRIQDLKLEEKLDVAANIGSCSGLLARSLGTTQINSLIQVDISSGGLRRCKKLVSMLPPKLLMQYVLCDEEALPFKENSLDLVTTCLDLHWVNDLAGCFQQIRSALRDNKAVIGSIFGGDTLYELRSSLQLAEMERLSGFSSHIAPKTTGQDVARLMQASGFELITVDISEIRIHYPSIFELMFDLQGMGENNASLIGSQHMHRDVLEAAASIYQTFYGNPNDFDQGVPATFQFIHFIGWKSPHQSTPLKSAP